MRFLGLCLILGAGLSARAQVAVAVTLPDNNPAHREVAAGLVEAVDDVWLMLEPQLDPVDVAVCQTESACLLGHALARHASHLLVIGVAGLGVRDYVVSVQLYDAHGTKLVDENSVESASPNPADVGAALAVKLLPWAGVPPARALVPPPPPGPSALGLTGMALVAGSGVVGVGLTIAAVSVKPSVALQTSVVVGSALAVVLGAAGAACVVVDAL